MKINAKNIIRIFVILILISNPFLRLFAQHKFQFRSSIGIANQVQQDGIFTKGITNDTIIARYNVPENFVEKWFPPQFGFMLEYKHNAHHTIDIGIAEGAIKSSFQIGKSNNINVLPLFSNSISMYESFNKWGLEYTYSFAIPDHQQTYNEITNRFLFSGLLSINNCSFSKSLASNKGYSVAVSTVDSMVVKRDSVSSYVNVINRKFVMISPGFRAASINKKKNEKCSITVIYDISLQELATFHNDAYNNILNQKIYASTQSTRANQWKVYSSLPLVLYDFNKKVHRLGSF